MESKADVLLHPVRLRIAQVLAQGRPLTPQQLGEAMPDVPQASLYRHLQKLAEAGLVEVIGERAVRGAKEKTYALPARGLHLGPDDVASATRDDHQRYFTAFVASLLGSFGRYLERPVIDFARDGVGYHTHMLHLSDAELLQLAGALNQALMPFFALEPSAERTPRLFSTVLMPADDRPHAPGQPT